MHKLTIYIGITMIKRYYFISGFAQKEIGEVGGLYFSTVFSAKSWFVNSDLALKKITDFIKSHPTFEGRELIITSFNRV